MQVSGLLIHHVCQLWCVIPEPNYECETTCHLLLPPANWALTKFIEDTLKILNINTVFNNNRIIFYAAFMLYHHLRELMCHQYWLFLASGCII